MDDNDVECLRSVCSVYSRMRLVKRVKGFELSGMEVRVVPMLSSRPHNFLC